MPIDVACTRCGFAYSVKDDAAGRRFKCKECGDVIEVPGIALGEVAPPAAPGGRDELDDPATRETRGTEAPRVRRRRVEDDEFAPTANPLGKVSLILGCIVWGLGIVSFIALMIMGFSVAHMMEQNGGRDPNEQEAMKIGFMALGACGIGCLGLLTSLVGAVLGGIALSQDDGSKGQAIAGLILNGLFLLGGVGMVVLSVILGQNQ